MVAKFHKYSFFSSILFALILSTNFTYTSTPTILTFSTGAAPSAPRTIALGSDGNLWYTDVGDSLIGRITPQGVITKFSTLNASPSFTLSQSINAQPEIIEGPDGNLWFTVTYPVPGIAKITTAGQMTFQTLPLPFLPNSQPTNLIVGPGQTLWFIDQVNDRIGKVNILANSFNIIGFATVNNDTPRGIAVGSDSNIWYTAVEISGLTRSEIVKVDLNSLAQTTYPVGTYPEGHQLSKIALGNDGNLWFSDQGNPFASVVSHAIGQITTGGVITEFSLPSTSSPFLIIAGLGQIMWFIDNGKPRAIGSITTTASPMINSFPTGSIDIITSIALGPDGNLWFADAGGVGFVDVLSQMLTRFPITGMPDQIVDGPNNNMWFTNSTLPAIQEICLSQGSTQLNISKTADKATVNVGEEITYTIKIINSGPNTATNVMLEDMVPSNTTFISSNTSCDLSSGSCLIGNIAQGLANRVTVTLVVRVNQGSEGQTIINNASITADQCLLSGSNSSASVSVLVNQLAPLTLVKSGPSIVLAGSFLTYNLKVTNNTGTTTHVSISDPIFTSAERFISATDGGRLSPDGNAVLFDFDLGPFGSKTVSFTVRVNDTTSGVLTNLFIANGITSAPIMTTVIPITCSINN